MNEFPADIKKLNIFELSIIIVFWTLLFVSPLIFRPSLGTSDWEHVLSIWKEHAVLLALFLLNRFVLLPFLFFRDKRAIYIVTAVCLIIIAAGGMFLYDKAQGKGFNRKPQQAIVQPQRPDSRPPRQGDNRPGRQEPQRPGPERHEPVPAYINLLILSVLVFGFDTGLKITSRWVKSEQQRMNLQKEHIQTQLALLKHQISPHFFMNTLNNIHSLIDINTAEAKKSVIRLSNLMRHLLYESDHEYNSLKSEIEFITSYVDLMKLRYSDKVKIILKIPDQIPEKTIPPLLFISLLDNAFKHGISYVRDSFIEIVLSFEGENLLLYIRNSKSRDKVKGPVSGIGIENTRKRLDLLYKERYRLELTDTGDLFITKLVIPV